MHARPLCIIVLGFLLGILAAATESKWMLLPAIGMFILLAGRIKVEKSRLFAYGKLLFYSIGFLCGSYRYEAQQEFMAVYEPVLYDGMRITLQGELEEKEYKNNTYLYYLNNCYLKLEQGTVPGSVVVACNQIIAEMETDEVSIGKILVLEGSVSVFHKAANEGNFDEVSFYKSQKIDFKLKDVTLKEQYGEEDVFRESLYRLKQRLRSVYETCMTAETGGVISMMTLGDKSLIDQEVKELYQKVGISHVLAISGLHISVIGMTVYKLFRRIFGSFVIPGICAGAFMFAYGCMTGFRPSATRAIIMFFMMLIGQMSGRSYDSLSALSLSALCLLWENPFLPGYAGFLFSYAAVLGVVLVGNLIIRTFEEKKKIRDSIYSSFSIQLMTVPLTAYFYYEIPVYGMLVNFIVLPLMSALLSIGLIGGLVGLVWLDAAKWILVPCQFILLFYQKLSAIMQNLPAATLITGQPELWRMIVFYSVLTMTVYLVWKRKKARGFVLTGVLMLAFVLYLPKDGMELDVLDVGQGDGIYLRTESGYDIFVDGGSSSVSKVGTYRILPFLKFKGVQKIDYWFVSHADKDHISGLLEILEEGYAVENLVFAEQAVVDDTCKELVTLAESAGTQVLWMGYMDCLHLGDARMTCVFPYGDFETEDKNAASLVLYYEESDFNGLFTGDIGVEEEAWIAEHSAEWLNASGDESARAEESVHADAVGIDFYKVAHHGSRYSNSSELLQVLEPEIAVISCGANNSYGHPHGETLERLEDAGCDVWNTAESGQIIVEEGTEAEVRGWVDPTK